MPKVMWRDFKINFRDCSQIVKFQSDINCGQRTASAVTASVILRELAAVGAGNVLSQALRAHDRIER